MAALRTLMKGGVSGSQPFRRVLGGLGSGGHKYGGEGGGIRNMRQGPHVEQKLFIFGGRSTVFGRSIMPFVIRCEIG